LLPVSPELARVAVVILSVFEVGLAIVIWWWVSALLLVVPVVFWGMLILSYFKGVECGCFGSLPFFSQISMSGHFLLLIGLFLGLYYLTAVREATENSEQKSKEVKTSSLKWVGVGAVALMLAAFLPLPSPSKSQAANLSANNIVDRAYVEAAISYPNIPILDARTLAEFDFGHIPGAVNIPYNNSKIGDLIEKHSLRNKHLIVYCSSARCNVAHILAGKLRKLGCERVKIYAGGWEDWQRHLD
jgi:rhodanese-related sulfurtransferase